MAGVEQDSSRDCRAPGQRDRRLCSDNGTADSALLRAVAYEAPLILFDLKPPVPEKPEPPEPVKPRTAEREGGARSAPVMRRTDHSADGPGSAAIIALAPAIMVPAPVLPVAASRLSERAQRNRRSRRCGQRPGTGWQRHGHGTRRGAMAVNFHGRGKPAGASAIPISRSQRAEPVASKSGYAMPLIRRSCR